MKNQFQALVQSAFLAGQSIASCNSGNRSSISSEKATRRVGESARGVASLAAALLILSVCSLAAQAQTLLPGWYQQSPLTSPSARFIHALTYDAKHNQVVVFGGLGGNYLNDTWLWDGTNWSQANPTTSPSPRAALAMVYDAAHGQVVLFGGLDPSGNRLGDTWLWDGANWTQASPASSPGARDGAYMVYDSLHGQVVLFGGTNGTSFNDTWTWNGTNWTNVTPTSPAPSPSPRADMAMAFDAAHGQVVLFGGSNGPAPYMADTWTWDGANWTQQSPPNSPPARERRIEHVRHCIAEELGRAWCFAHFAWRATIARTGR